MRITSIQIQNFRAFRDETVHLESYTCFVGRNGAGKSTILHALNLFFRQTSDMATNLSHLSTEDFHHKNTSEPIQVTVTFCDLSTAAKQELSHYVRQDRLIVTAKATYDPAAGTATVRQYGSRLGIEKFQHYFEAEKAGQKAPELKRLYSDLRVEFEELPEESVKQKMADALRAYETQYPEKCVEIRSEDQFYGARGTNILDPYIQWVFVPATKDYGQEGREAKTTALGQLLARTVRLKADFSPKIRDLKQKLEAEYLTMLSKEQSVLDELSASLQDRLQSWAHPAVTAKIVWEQDIERALRIEEPLATVQLGERGFHGDIARFGHGLQRTYLLTLLQELSALEDKSQPTLVMAIEEPEIYQHPPQSRHLSGVLRDLANKGSQILCCTHSPLFIPGTEIEAVKVVRESGDPAASIVRDVTYQKIADRLNVADPKLIKEEGMIPKLYSMLNPTVSEMFFCDRLILVEGLEDLAHLMAYIEKGDRIDEYRRYGCHIVPVGGKSELLRPLAVALELGIPVFVVWDADTEKTKESEVARHKKDNASLQRLLGEVQPNDWPTKDMGGENYWIWRANLTATVSKGLGSAWSDAQEKAAVRYGQPGNLEKNPVAIVYAHEQAWNNGQRCTELLALVDRIMTWASDCPDQHE